MSENWNRSEIRILINDKSQGSIAKHLSWDGLLHYKYIIQFASERILKSVNIWISYTQMVDCVKLPIRLRRLSSEMRKSPGK